MAGSDAEALATLAGLVSSLDAVAVRLKADARPPAAVLDEFTATIRLAHERLAGFDGELPDAGATDRLAALRMAVAVRAKLMTVARLVAGSAWYASLARELDGGDRMKQAGTYGRKGDAGLPATAPSIERRA